MQLMKTRHLAALMVMATSSVAAAPPSVVTQGRGAVTACLACHGMDGAGNALSGFPMLAQLPQAYIIKQIADYKSGTRSNPVMTPIAKALTPEDTEAAARYYSGLSRPAIKPEPADPALIARGKSLAINGAWDRQVPPCFKCHATGGVGVPPSFPSIAGQHASYTVSQLQAWKKGARTNDPQKLMKAVVQGLTTDDMRAVAEYLATLSAQGKTK